MANQSSPPAHADGDLLVSYHVACGWGLYATIRLCAKLVPDLSPRCLRYELPRSWPFLIGTPRMATAVNNNHVPDSIRVVGGLQFVFLI